MLSQDKIKALQEGEKRGRKFYFLLTDIANNKVGEIRAVTSTTAKIWRDEANVKNGGVNRNAELYTEIDKSQINSPAIEAVIEKLKSISKTISVSEIVANALNKPTFAPAVKKTRPGASKVASENTDSEPDSNFETN